MIKKTIKFILVILIIGLIFFAIKITPFAVEGYELYKKQTSLISLDDEIEKSKLIDCYTKLDELPPNFIDKLLISEDENFYSHKGFNLTKTISAFLGNMQKGYLAEGGSTITQQLAKNIYYSFEKKYSRKFAELFTIVDIEKEMNKDEILEMYLNIIYFGNDCYGIGDASQFYYEKEPIELTDIEMDRLIFTIKSPNNYNPNVYSYKN